MLSENDYVVLATCLVCAGAVYIGSRRHHSTDCRDLVCRLYPHQLRGLEDLLNDPGESKEFWARTHGVAGLWRRWRNRVVLVQLCQERGANDPSVTAEELQFVLSCAGQLNSASLKALFAGLAISCMPEVLCRFEARRGYGIMARCLRVGHEALQLYSEIAFQTHALFAYDPVDMCGSMLSSVL